jgi:geranylgeranyl reductase family protein
VSVEVFETIIIGAGPAGSFAAERLARGGCRVALFDGRPEDEQKACGGGVTSKALKAWPELQGAVGRTIERIEMYSPAGKRLALKLADPFAIYSRSVFDSFLRDRAASAGSRVFNQKLSFNSVRKENGSWVAQLNDGSVIEARVLVAADGANSRFAKEFAGPLPNAEMEVAFGYRAPIPENGRCETVVAFMPGWAGYAWAFPRIDHISFGIATSQDTFDHKALDRLLWDFMLFFYAPDGGSKGSVWAKAKRGGRNLDVVTEFLEKNSERYAARIPGLAAGTWDQRRTVGDGWALLGDAAGFADPVTGEGIYYALRSGELFAQSYLSGDMDMYEKLWREDFGRELKRASEMRTRFYGSFWGAPFTERMIEFARGHRGIRKVLGELVAGDQGYTDLKSRLAKSALRPI